MKAGGLTRSRTAGLLLIGVFAMPLPAMTADIFVNTTADTNDGICIPPFGCSLRDAVMIANSNSGTDTIHVPAGVYNLTITGPGGAEEGDLDIEDDVDIEGAGAGVTVIDGMPDAYVFDTHDDVPDGYPLLQLFDLTIAGGSNGLLTINSSLYLWRCIVEVQSGTSAIFGHTATVLMVDSVSRGSVAAGIWVQDSSLWVLRSTIANNLAVSGAGVRCSDSAVTFTNATVTGNSNWGPEDGGGFSGNGCDVLITGSTFAGNLPKDLDLDPDMPNTATVRNTYIGSVCPPDTANQVTSEGGNVGSPNCGLIHASDIDFAGGTAILLPLGDYGGYTPTMPPWGTPNPLVDNVSADPNCLTEDQRGISRPEDGGGDTLACDTGAVERTHIFLDDFESGDTTSWSGTVP